MLRLLFPDDLMSPPSQKKFILVLPVCIYLRHFNFGSLIYVLIAVILIISSTLRHMCIHMMNFHDHFLYLVRNVLPYLSSQDGFSSVLPIGFYPPFQPLP